jgi:hypothetical protein
MASFMLSVDEPIVALGGTFLQIFCGIIIALIILPSQQAHVEIRLWMMMMMMMMMINKRGRKGLSVLAIVVR